MNIRKLFIVSCTFLLAAAWAFDFRAAEPAETTEDDRVATASVLSENDWSALVAEYRKQALPLPPADAPLFARFYDMEEYEDRDRDLPFFVARYSLGFLIATPGDPKKSQLLIGTEFLELDDVAVTELHRIDPNEVLRYRVNVVNEGPDFPLNAALPTAVQCYARGWRKLADELLRLQANRSVGHPQSVFYQPANLPPIVALRMLAWARGGNQLANAEGDRAAVLRQIRELSQQEPRLQSPACRALVDALAASLEPFQSTAGSVERLIDQLTDADGVLWSDSFLVGEPESVRRLSERGFEALPAMLAHLNDRRLTRIVQRPWDGSAPYLVTTGEVLGNLIQDLAGDAGRLWKRSPTEHFLVAEPVNEWWQRAREMGEEAYLVQSAVPRSPQATRVYRAMLTRLARQYPRRLLDLYPQLLSDRPDISSWELVHAIVNLDISQEEKVQTLLLGAASQSVNHQAEALDQLAELDRARFDELLLSGLRALATSTPGRYAASEQIQLAQLCWKTDHKGHWYALRDFARRADLGVRMEILYHMTDKSDLPRSQELLLREFLAAFLNDSTTRRISSNQEKYSGCAGDNWPEIEVRNWAAFLLAKRYEFDVSELFLNKAPDAQAWKELRVRVAQHRQDLGETDIPSYEQQLDAEEKLRSKGGLLLETDNGVDGRRLTNVSLWGSEIQDGDLRLLRSLPDLREVNLARTSITDAGMKELAKCRGLRVLTLSDTKITDVGLAHLAELKGLTELDLSNTTITGTGLAKLAGLVQLEQLKLDSTKLTDAGLEAVGKLPNLEYLSLHSTAITDKGLGHLSRLQRLAVLDLMGTDISDRGMPAIAECRQLVSLTLSLTKVTDAGLTHVAKLSKLQRLYLFGQPITDEGVITIGRLRRLTFLSLSSDKVTDRGVKSLRHLGELESLYLDGTSVTDRGVEELASLHSLMLLDLSSTSITDQAMEHVRQLPKLRQLLLSNTKVSSEAKERLRKVKPQLEILD